MLPPDPPLPPNQRRGSNSSVITGADNLLPNGVAFEPLATVPLGATVGNGDALVFKLNPGANGLPASFTVGVVRG